MGGCLLLLPIYLLFNRVFAQEGWVCPAHRRVKKEQKDSVHKEKIVLCK